MGVTDDAGFTNDTRFTLNDVGATVFGEVYTVCMCLVPLYRVND